MNGRTRLCDKEERGVVDISQPKLCPSPSSYNIRHPCTSQLCFGVNSILFVDLAVVVAARFSCGFVASICSTRTTT